MQYQRTHPWLTFTLDLSQMSANFWFLLGAAQSKCKHISRVPMKPEFAKNLYSVSLAKGALATTAIEGNTLSLEEVMDRIDAKSTLPKSREYLGIEIDNIVEAFNAVASAEISENGDRKLAVDDIKQYNSMILKNVTALSDDVTPGEIRTYAVSVGEKYRGAPAEDCEFLLNKFCDWMNDSEWWAGLGNDKKVATGILKAIVAHLYFAWIHPFGDGNGRTARLLELKLLLDNGVPTAAAHLLSNFYNETRSQYYSALEKTSLDGGNPGYFVEYALQGFVDALDAHIDAILQEQVGVAWINYVHDTFRKESATRVSSRQRDLLLEISKLAMTKPVTKREIMASITLNVALSKQYESHQRMFQRDINALLKMKLLERGADLKYSPALNIILQSYISPSITQ